MVGGQEAHKKPNDTAWRQGRGEREERHLSCASVLQKNEAPGLDASASCFRRILQLQLVIMEHFLQTIPNQEMDEKVTGRGPKSLDQRYLKTTIGGSAENLVTVLHPGLPTS